MPPVRDPQFTAQLRRDTAAVRLMHGRLGVRRALSKEQVKHAAESFRADGNYLSAGKKLINTRHPAYRSCTRLVSQARCYWRTMTVPFPVKGIRLLRRDRLEMFDLQMTTYRLELREATQALQDIYAELRAEAQERLGELFNATDYPTDVRDAFSIEWDFPSVEPPDYLQQINPRLYQAEQEKAAARLDEAIRLAEDAFAAELQELVAHLVDRLAGDGTSDGKPKVLRESAVSNLTEFVERFRSMQVGSNAELEALVQQSEQVVGGVDIADLRRDASLRQSIASQMATVREALDGMVVARPSRHLELEDDE